MSREKINILEMARGSVRELKPYASAKDEFKDFDRELIYLDANENPYDNGLNRYPDPNQLLLKQKISEIKNIPVENILLGNGSDEVLDMIFRVFFEPGKDNIIINTPTFGMFKVLSNLNNIGCREVSLTTDFQLDVAAITKAMDDSTKAIFICSPNNPTGNLMKAADIKALLELGVIVVIDEAYIDFAQEQSWITKLDQYNNLIVSQTFSKAFGLAGIRLGVCYADSRIIDLLKKVKMPYNVNVLTQTTALKYLENKKVREQQILQIVSNREQLANDLLKIGFVEKIYPSDSNFILVKVDDADKRYQQLIGRELIIRNRSKEPLCENCLRITVGTSKENTRLMKSLLYLDTNKNLNS
ncbi:histidinol-phosphate transaminase [Lutimonas vermicola]|uniref:Histidinol-phosphate aminotransferase n=1 Tax=Lutimonas vermicola TaxID=414288 RepID=A0ABU9KXQ3_9FLAO